MELIKISAIWCPSCLIMEKIWQELKQDLPKIDFISYDYDLDDESETYQVGETLPVIILKNNEEELIRFVGEKTKQELLEEITKHLLQSNK